MKIYLQVGLAVGLSLYILSLAIGSEVIEKRRRKEMRRRLIELLGFMISAAEEGPAGCYWRLNRGWVGYRVDDLKIEVKKGVGVDRKEGRMEQRVELGSLGVERASEEEW